MTSPTSDVGTDASARYEALRAAALSPDPCPRPAHGVAVFLLRGMAGWIDALPHLESRACASPLPVSKDPAGSARAGPDLVYILANMILSCVGGEP